MEANPGFSEFANSGFHIRFENGWKVSVQFGPANYCSNRSMEETISILDETILFGQELSCANAEVAAWDASGNPHMFNGDLSKGWVTPGELLALMVEIAAKV